MNENEKLWNTAVVVIDLVWADSAEQAIERLTKDVSAALAHGKSDAWVFEEGQNAFLSEPNLTENWDGERRVARCRQCGESIQDDPDGSPGVVVHHRQLDAQAFDLDEDHAAIADEP